MGGKMVVRAGSVACVLLALPALWAGGDREKAVVEIPSAPEAVPAPGMVVGRDAACQPVWRDADVLVVRGGQELAAPSPAELEVMRRDYGCTLYGIGIDDLERAVARGMRYDYPVVVLYGFERDPDDDESLAARKAVVEGHVDPSSVGRWSGPLFAGRQLRRLAREAVVRAGLDDDGLEAVDDLPPAVLVGPEGRE